MSERIEWVKNSMLKEFGKGASIKLLSLEEVNKARDFHRTIPDYRPTPLRSLPNLAKALGVGGIYVKDESYRFGLNAFKALGASYSMAHYLAQQLGQDIRELPYSVLTSAKVKKALGEITFASTTDGNHGRAVAWTARQLQQKAVIYMPKGSSPRRLENIRAEGAEASITDLNYDDAVRMTAAEAEKHGWVIVQDTAWEGYEEIPGWIMQGYGTMAAETLDELKAQGVEKPTHVLVQAGVGALAGTVQGYYASVLGKDRPKTVIVEANKADCHFQSALAGDGSPRVVSGDMNTIMAGLACGEPNILGWNILKDYSEMFASCPDWVTAKGMRLLGNPLGDDPRVISGESGAVTAGFLWHLLHDQNLQEAKQALQLDETSQVLLFSTEGDTDPEKYRSIVWDGEFPSFAR